FVELHRRDPEIRQHTVHLSDAALIEHGVELPIVRVHDLDALPEWLQRDARRLNRRGIAIESDQPRRARLEQRTRVATQADRAIDEHAAPRRLEMFEHLRDHDRFVQWAQGSWLRPPVISRAPTA